MDETTKAYIAGLLDGEGCFHINKFATTKSPIGFQYRSVVEVAMCDKSPIEFAAKATGKNFSEKPLKSGRIAYVLVWRNGIAANLIREILPYLHGKRDQAELLLYFEDHVTPGRGRTYKQSDAIICEDIRMRVKEMKAIPIALRC